MEINSKNLTKEELRKLDLQILDYKDKLNFAKKRRILIKAGCIKLEVCKECNGKGKISSIRIENKEFGVQEHIPCQKPCTFCHATGYIENLGKEMSCKTAEELNKIF